MNLEGFLKILERYWHKRTSTIGLFVGFLISCGIVLGLSGAFHSVAIAANFISNDADGARLYFAVTFLIALVVCVFYWVLWMVWRQILVPFDNAIIVIFAPWAEDEHQEVVRRLHDKFNVELASRGLGKLIHSKLLPREDSVLNIAESERVVRERGASLVIFGRVTSGGLKGKKAEGFCEISFTLNHKVITQEDANSLAASFFIEDFAIKEENSFFDAKFASENLGNCACAFIGMSLTAQGKYKEAREVWQSLFDKTKSRVAPANEKQLRFSNFISRWFQRNEFCWTLDYYHKNLAPNISSRFADSAAQICQERLQFLLGLNPKFSDYLNLQSILQFHRNDVKGALKTIDELEKQSPKGFPPMFSRPFLTLWQRKYKPALRYFKRLENKISPPPPFIMSVVSFYESLILQYPDRHELKFGSAFVNDLFCDQKIAQENYVRFLAEAKGTETYSPLTEYAAERLVYLRQEEGFSE